MQQTHYDDMVFRDPGESQDCLTLNVWAPAQKSKTKLPVMVWIFGGGFAAGGTSSRVRTATFHPQRRSGRLHELPPRYFWVFRHQITCRGNPHHAAGNYGLMDQWACLQWVRRNIKAFGGDPDNVTIFGESAGSFAVSAQMASPLSKGLFAHAIGESGGAFLGSRLTFPSLEQAEKRDEDYFSSVRSDSNLAALRAASSTVILELATRKVADRPCFGPDIDGYFLPAVFPRSLPRVTRPTYR